jgi:LuxR family maltose regulon positive regulatory protein
MDARCRVQHHSLRLHESRRAAEVLRNAPESRLDGSAAATEFGSTSLFHAAAHTTASYRELVPYVRGLAGIQDPTDGSSAGASLNSVSAEALTAREGKILRLIAEGLSNKAMARELAIAPETVKSHMKHIFTKLGFEKRAQAVSRAQTLGLLRTQPA